MIYAACSFQYSNVNCDGTEQMLIDCESTIILPDAGLELAQHVDIVGVSCTTRETISGESTGSKLTTSYVATIGIISVLFIMSILIVIRSVALMFLFSVQVSILHVVSCSSV